MKTRLVKTTRFKEGTSRKTGAVYNEHVTFFEVGNKRLRVSISCDSSGNVTVYTNDKENTPFLYLNISEVENKPQKPKRTGSLK